LPACHLEFGVTLWGGATASLLKPLVSMHKKALRVATGATYNAHSDPLFASINLLKFEDIYTLRVASMASSIIEKRAPPGIASCFRIIEPHENLRNYQSPSLYVPQCKTDKTKIFKAYIQQPALFYKESRHLLTERKLPPLKNW
jgi:hypothetical protein